MKILLLLSEPLTETAKKILSASPVYTPKTKTECGTFLKNALLGSSASGSV